MFSWEIRKPREEQALWEVDAVSWKMAVDSYSKFRGGSFGKDDKQG